MPADGKRRGEYMLIERTKEKRKESMMTAIGEILSQISKWLMVLSDEMCYTTVEKEVK